MKRIFEHIKFRNYSQKKFKWSMNPNKKICQFVKPKIIMFNSHKYDELEDLKDILGFFDKYFDVKVYINSKDLSLPTIISRETASRIKKELRIATNLYYLLQMKMELLNKML